LTIHTAVKQAKRAFDKSANPRLRAWGPTVTGLAIVPALPYIFDHPVEVAADRAFEWVEQKLAKFDKGAETSAD
jgi:fission process protein 1